MENTLKETEWLTINKVLLEMYDITDIDQFTERVLKTYRMLIPYTKGYFIVFNEAGGIESEKSSFIEMEYLLKALLPVLQPYIFFPGNTMPEKQR